jgi:NADH:ubiquinone reductase (H+-translocating)
VAKIVIVGGGYSGFYTAFKLERLLRRNEAEVVIVDPLPYMTYQPFLPEVAAGSIEARHAIVPLRQHLKRTRVVTARVTGVDHANKTLTITPEIGEAWTENYDNIVVTAGAVSRTFPIPGVADVAIGMKTIEEAVAVRDRLIDSMHIAANLPPGPERDRLLTVVVVGGGFAGIETIAELRSLASSMLRQFPTLSIDDTHFHLVEAMDRIMPEVSLKTSKWVIKNLESRHCHIHLNTQLVSALNGRLELSNGTTVETDLVIWTAGVKAATMLAGSGIPLDDRGRITAQADLRVVDGEDVLDGLWTAGDVAAVPDLTGGGVGGYCVPNAQHAVRQGKLLAKNLVAILRGEQPKDYFHKNLGAVAGLGLGVGVFQSGPIALTGFLAWVAHRGYHGLAMPMWERKVRVFSGWVLQLFWGRDTASVRKVQRPRAFFEEFASRPAAAAKAGPTRTRKKVAEPAT